MKPDKHYYQQVLFIGFVLFSAVALFNQNAFFQMGAFIFGIAFGATLIYDMLQ